MAAAFNTNFSPLSAPLCLRGVHWKDIHEDFDCKRHAQAHFASASTSDRMHADEMVAKLRVSYSIHELFSPQEAPHVHDHRMSDLHKPRAN
jgi:hypothetical protein